MKKFIVLSLTLLTTLTFFTQQIQAQGLLNFGQNSGGNSDSATSGIMKEIETAIGLNVGGQSGEAINIGVIISALLPYLYVFGGLTLFVMLIWGGFEMMAGATEAKSQEAGKQRITAAVIGFVILFASYWIAQLLQILFGIQILGK